MICKTCKDELWVCEEHPDRAWDSWHQLNCGAGMPCECWRERRDLVTDDEEKRLINFEFPKRRKK